mmetsp:Transcript_31446/g.50771  ORF Transcript_31446/g.50771 Transcript_31446/m.50771 type:complete len:247 (+) Transcript_31446:968-1708(+)
MCARNRNARDMVLATSTSERENTSYLFAMMITGMPMGSTRSLSGCSAPYILPATSWKRSGVSPVLDTIPATASRTNLRILSSQKIAVSNTDPESAKSTVMTAIAVFTFCGVMQLTSSFSSIAPPPSSHRCATCLTLLFSLFPGLWEYSKATVGFVSSFDVYATFCVRNLVIKHVFPELLLPTNTTVVSAEPSKRGIAAGSCEFLSCISVQRSRAPLVTAPAAFALDIQEPETRKYAKEIFPILTIS